jgi:hypothetical protein
MVVKCKAPDSTGRSGQHELQQQGRKTFEGKLMARGSERAAAARDSTSISLELAERDKEH